jgi:hypothetical protein
MYCQQAVSIWCRLPALGLLAALALGATGCGSDASTGPGDGTGSIAVALTTTGSSPDPDGYTISLDGGPAEVIGANATRTLPQLSAGNHTLTLAGVADNCEVAGANPRTVAVSAGGTAQSAFAVSCTGAPLALRFVWSQITATSARWEQAYSPDAGKTWETNWVMEFRRAS